jgi:1-acyl-sn-glycerol-3-phosphate acyltransferase
MLAAVTKDTPSLSLANHASFALVPALNRLLFQEKTSSLTRGRFRFHS